jgi:hypothetical protein
MPDDAPNEDGVREQGLMTVFVHGVLSSFYYFT